MHNGDLIVNGDLKIGNIEKISNNDKYIPSSKNAYSNHNDVDDFSYSFFSNRILSLMASFSILMAILFITIQIILGRSVNDYFINICMLVSMFTLLSQKSK